MAESKIWVFDNGLWLCGCIWGRPQNLQGLYKPIRWNPASPWRKTRPERKRLRKFSRLFFSISAVKQLRIQRFSRLCALCHRNKILGTINLAESLSCSEIFCVTKCSPIESQITRSLYHTVGVTDGLFAALQLNSAWWFDDLVPRRWTLKSSPLEQGFLHIPWIPQLEPHENRKLIGLFVGSKLTTTDWREAPVCRRLLRALLWSISRRRPRFTRPLPLSNCGVALVAKRLDLDTRLLVFSMKAVRYLKNTTNWHQIPWPENSLQIEILRLWTCGILWRLVQEESHMGQIWETLAATRGWQSMWIHLRSKEF